MEIRVKNLKSKIITDNPKLLKALIEVYSFPEKGYQYSPAYRQGRWDGKKKFITKAGYFRTGLLNNVLDTLQKIECTPDIIYDESFDLELSDYRIDGFTLYDYQEALVSEALEAKRAVIKSPTGSGKTIIMASMLKALEGYKGVILFNAKHLIRQSYEFFTDACGLSNVGISFGDGYVYGDIMLCTVQSIETILDTHLEEAQFLMVDECHEFANGNTTVPAIKSFPNAGYRFGFTATLPPDAIPMHNLLGAFGPVVEEHTTADLVDIGKLTKPIIQLIERPYNAAGRDEEMSYAEVYDEFIVYNDERNDTISSIIEDIRANNQKAKVLVLTKSLDHGRILLDKIGENCFFLEGADSLQDRYKVISKFLEIEEPSILIGTKILQTGVNIEEITHFINARGMKSEIATIQALGRALRKHESKDRVYVYDFIDKERYLDKHATARKRTYKREGHEVKIV